jgi:alpha-tubulin suppressor-like RCC1 family protein
MRTRLQVWVVVTTVAACDGAAVAPDASMAVADGGRDVEARDAAKAPDGGDVGDVSGAPRDLGSALDGEDARDAEGRRDATDVGDVTDAPRDVTDAPRDDDAPVDAAADVPSALGTVSEITVGLSNVCARLTDGTVRCWGQNDQGQLGNGATSFRSVPVPTPVLGLTGVAQVAVGHYHACARMADGTVRCWGRNAFGQLGVGSSSLRELTPAPVPGLADVAEIALGLEHTCARMVDTSVRCWGANGEGQLGDGTTTTYRAVPAPVPGLTGVVRLALGSGHSCVRMADATVRCWGSNARGQLGVPGAIRRPTPTPVTGLTDVAEVALGGAHTCARMADGTVRCWGGNDWGVLGDGTTTHRTAPMPVAGLAGVARIHLGHVNTCVRMTDGTARCWGRNAYGQLGDGTSAIFQPVPVPVLGLTDAAELAPGGSHTCARLVDGSARCWGANDYGQLGDGTTATRRSPAPVVFP